MGKRRIYEQDYKRQVVELSYRRDSIQSLARELDIKADLVYRWRKELIQEVPPPLKEDGKDSLSELQIENTRLQRALKDKALDLEILKKAMAIFSQRDGKS